MLNAKHALLPVILLIAACGGTSPAPGPTLNVAIMSPTAPILTNSATPLQITVSVSGGVADSVQLVQVPSNTSLTTCIASNGSFSCNLNTSSLPEGLIKLVGRAMAGASQFSSSELEITVDRTKPAASNRTPANGDLEVSRRAEIAIEFNEALQSADVTADNIRLTSAGIQVPATVALSSNGRKIAITPSNFSVLRLDQTQQVTISNAVKDLAGNPIDTGAGMTLSWSWRTPTMVLMGSSLNSNNSNVSNSPLITVDENGNPIVVLNESSANFQSGDAIVKRWNGTTWVSLGGGLRGASAASAGAGSIALDAQGNPVVAYFEHTVSPSTSRLLVKRWNGSSWVSLGGALNISNNIDFRKDSLKLTASGEPVIAYAEDFQNIFVKRWTGTSWDVLGGGITGNSPSLAIGSNGNPRIAFVQRVGISDTESVFVSEWTGSAWANLGGVLNIENTRPTFSPSISLGAGETPFVQFGDKTTPSSGVSNVYVKRWTGSAWSLVGDRLNAAINTEAFGNGLQVASNGSPVILISDSLPPYAFPTISIRRWNGTNWDTLPLLTPTPTGPFTYNPNFVLDSSGNPLVTYVQRPSGNNPDIIVVRRYNQ